MTYEADELRRTWKKCFCPIYASGTLTGQFKRKNTERTAWPDDRGGMGKRGIVERLRQVCRAAGGCRSTNLPAQHRRCSTRVPQHSRRGQDRTRNAPQVSNIHEATA